MFLKHWMKWIPSGVERGMKFLLEQGMKFDFVSTAYLASHLLKKLRGRGGLAHCICSFAIEALFFSFKGILIEDFMSG